jgi:thiamine biosynthesis lipoprotein ApbE
MNTGLDVVFWGVDASLAESVFDKIENCVAELEMAISRYNPCSELFLLNQKATVAPVGVSRLLWDALQQAICFHRQTLGYFDISLGRAFHALKSGLQKNPEIQQSFIGAIEMNPENQSVKFLHPDVLIDFGGVGKGLALQSIARMLEEHEIRNAFISFGGSSVLTRGRHPHGETWPFGLANVTDNFKTIYLNNDAISVSSTKRQVANGSPYHIVDPISTQIVLGEKTAVVRNQSPVFAEVLSTVLLVSPENKHKEIIANFGQTEYQLINN